MSQYNLQSSCPNSQERIWGTLSLFALAVALLSFALSLGLPPQSVESQSLDSSVCTCQADQPSTRAVVNYHFEFKVSVTRSPLEPTNKPQSLQDLSGVDPFEAYFEIEPAFPYMILDYPWHALASLIGSECLELKIPDWWNYAKHRMCLPLEHPWSSYRYPVDLSGKEGLNLSLKELRPKRAIVCVNSDTAENDRLLCYT